MGCGWRSGTGRDAAGPGGLTRNLGMPRGCRTEGDTAPVPATLGFSDQDSLPAPKLDYFVPFLPSDPSPPSPALCSPPGS